MRLIAVHHDLQNCGFYGEHPGRFGEVLEQCNNDFDMAEREFRGWNLSDEEYRDFIYDCSGVGYCAWHKVIYLGAGQYTVIYAFRNDEDLEGFMKENDYLHGASWEEVSEEQVEKWKEKEVKLIEEYGGDD